MTNRRLMSLLAAAGVLVATSAQAQRFDTLLPQSEVQKLNDEARALYHRAVIAADHVNYTQALEILAAAGAAAPDSIDLQFLLAKEARGRAEITYGDESLANYDLAATALRRLLANPQVGPEERIRVARESERITEGKETLRARDDARLKDGFEFIMQIHQERRLASGLTSLAEEANTIDKTLNPEQEKETAEVLTKEDIWPALAAPGLALALPQPPPQPGYGSYGGFGEFGFGGFGDPTMPGGGFDPSMGAYNPGGGGYDPSMPGGGGYPGAAYPGGPAPYGNDPFAPNPGAANDPFANNPFGPPAPGAVPPGNPMAGQPGFEGGAGFGGMK